MDIEDQFSLQHLLFTERECRSCGAIKDLLSDFYLTKKAKRQLPSSYSYECKECTNKRIIQSKSRNNPVIRYYPDW
jgi:ribosomal protein L33